MVAHSSFVLFDVVVSIDYSMEMSFVWLVYSCALSLDLTVDVCMLQKHYQELHEVLEWQ